MKNIQILQSVSSFSAGPTYSVGSLSHCLNNLEGCEVQIIATGVKREEWKFKVNLKLFNSFLESAGLLSFNTIFFYMDAIKHDSLVIHQHGIWRSMNVLPLFGKKRAKLVWSPRGMFSEWSMKHHWLLKMPFWYLLQKPALTDVDCFHATSFDELNDIRRLGYKKPIALIANGVAVPTLEENSHKNKTIVFLGRIHEVKGVDLLIKSWNKIAEFYPDWNVVIAGALNSKYGEEMQLLVKALNVPRLEFIGAIFDEGKKELLANSSLFVLPSYTENFGIAVAEALAHATPVITTVNTPWQAVEEKQCGWCIENNETSWVKTLKTALDKSPKDLKQMGENGRNWMQMDFSWEEKAREIKYVYKWLIKGGEVPGCVYLDE